MKHDYICECQRDECRETFEMKVSDYTHLAVGGRLVKRYHMESGERVVGIVSTEVALVPHIEQEER
jgi:hypothetical protein